jgi:hypothetical protein
MNKYLEKIASNRLKQNLESKGMSFGDSRTSGASNASIMGSHANTAPTTKVPTGDKVFTPGRGGFMGMGKTPSITKATGATRTTGDSLAAGKPLRGLDSRLQDFRASNAAKKSVSGAKGILGRAVGLIKKNPLVSAGLALGAGVVGHKMMSSGNNQQQYANY